MPRSFSTEAVVLGSNKLREADRIVNLFTSARGKVPTVVKGIRKVSSRFGGRLEPFTVLQVQLHEGRSLHTLTGADTIKTHAPVRDNPAALKAGFSMINLLERETNELERRPRTFNLLLRFLNELEQAAKTGIAAGNMALLALGAELKLLLLAGYLPHLKNCAACGAETNLPRFSAQVGGVICADCPGESFAISEESLAVMRFLLENPLRKATYLQSGRSVVDNIWQVVKEICRYHLGIDLKVEPW